MTVESRPVDWWFTLTLVRRVGLGTVNMHGSIANKQRIKEKKMALSAQEQSGNR